MADPANIDELREAVVSLAERVTYLSTALSTVNDVQQKTATVMQDQKAVRDVLVPRDEHEQKWKEEQQSLIDLRLSIRRQTWIAGVAATVIGLGLFTASLLIGNHVLNAQNASRLASCEDRNQGFKNAVTFDNQEIAVLKAKPPSEVNSLAIGILTSARNGTLKEIVRCRI